MKNEQKTVDFTGVWQTNWGRLVLDQEGNVVAGRYGQTGVLAGKVKGNKLTFEWAEKAGDTSGTGHLIMSYDNKEFDGSWKFENSEDWAGTWHGVKIGELEEKKGKARKRQQTHYR